MPERISKLRQTIADLEAELAGLDSLDEETRNMLSEVSGEINAALGQEDASALEPDSLIERLQQSAREFEAEYPTLAGALERLTNALGQMGI